MDNFSQTQIHFQLQLQSLILKLLLGSLKIIEIKITRTKHEHKLYLFIRFIIFTCCFNDVDTNFWKNEERCNRCLFMSEKILNSN